MRLVVLLIIFLAFAGLDEVKKLILTAQPVATVSAVTADTLITAANPTLWLDAQYNVTTVGSKVSSWCSRGSGDCWVQPTDARRPTLGTTTGSFAAVKFLGDGGWLYSNLLFSDFFLQNGKTVLLVMKNSNTTSHHLIFSNDGQRFGLYFNNLVGTNEFAVYNDDGSGDFQTPTTTTTTLSLVEITHSSSTLRIRVNNDVQRTVTSGNTNGLGNVGWLGATDSGLLPWTGDMVLVLFWNRYVSGTEIADLKSAIASKYGITIS